MPRVVEITSDSRHTDELVAGVAALDGVVSVSVSRGASVHPRGDVVQVTASNVAARRILRRFSPAVDEGIVSIVFSEPQSVVSRDSEAVDRESNEGTIEDVASELRKEANPELNFLVLMVLAGSIAAAGLWAGDLHIVVGAMIVAPAFEPLLRLPFGLICGARESVLRGALATAAGYTGLALGAALTLLVVQGAGVDPTGDLGDRALVEYWSTVSGVGILVAVVAGAAGVMTVTAGRSVLTAGVMVALALIPSMAVTGMALADGDAALAGRGLVRWSVDATGVIVVGGLVLAAKQRTLHRHRASG